MVKRLTMTIGITPRTKKNSQQIVTKKVKGKSIPIIIPSKAYRQYEKDAGLFIKGKGLKIDYPVNLKVLYYMPTRRKVDLVNLLEATCDILVKYEVLQDDNSEIVKSHDGSRVLLDRENPRAEICIEALEIETQR